MKRLKRYKVEFTTGRSDYVIEGTFFSYSRRGSMGNIRDAHDALARKYGLGCSVKNIRAAVPHEPDRIILK